MTTSPKAEYKQETRFAVVMYGGVSLAIYINGITQELFHLVNSTARKEAGSDDALPVDELTPTQRVYRKLSYILSNRPFRERCQKEADECKKLKKPYKVRAAPDDDTIETRFVIDILSGTSAGGLNALFLGKALANNQNIDQLKELWVNEGDIGLLLNDKISVRGLGLEKQVPPVSLLNSRRMYLKLLRAFDDMEKSKQNGDDDSRFLDDAELDLFITTTDIAGVPLPIRLSDTVVFERRHRNVFHFKYAPKETGDDKDAKSNGETPDEKVTSGRNDFVSKNNPFLAFAARCTSSFPFAFEPMRLADIDEVLNTFPEYRANDSFRGASEAWQRFFNRNVINTLGKNIVDRPFGDGGYLDNKPFSFAVETIARREAELPVDRKLIYIEPSPEHPENDNLAVTQIDALRNVKAALLDLPAYETIRGDLERVMERNTLVNRVNQITDAIERDLEDSRVKRPTLRDGEWEKLDLAGMVQRFGIYYIPYRRLRIEATSDELARTVARMLTVDETSARYVAVRALIHAWREKTYIDENVQRRDDRIETLAQQLAEITTGRATTEQVEELEGTIRGWLQIHLSDAYSNSFASGNGDQPGATAGPESKPDIKTANQFLLHYDFKYWLRRLSFMRSKIDQLLQLHKVPDDAAFTEKQLAVVNKLDKFLGKPKYEELSRDEKTDLAKLLSEWRTELIKLHKRLRAAGRKIQSPSQSKEGSKEREFGEALRKIKLTPKVLDYILGTVNRDGGEQQFSKLKVEECALRAKHLLDDEEFARDFGGESLSADLENAARILRECVEPIMKAAWIECKTLMRDKTGGPTTPHAEGVREYLWHYLSKFDDYDQVRFPIMYGTDGGESDVVEVFRISPEDAPSLIDERAESQKPNGRTKLAGTSLHHFGAFLDKVWRQNDIMWGRLDGAERLITMLLPYAPDAALREALINEAHAAILREELSTESRSQLSALMSEALIRASTGEPIEDAINKVIEDLTESSPIKTRLASAMTAIFDDDLTKTEDDKLVKFVKLGYRVNRQLDTKSLLETISRATQTIGGIFEDLANKNDLDGKSLSWIARLGQFFWGLVQVAVPNSILNKVVTHWLYLLYTFEALIILAGVVLANDGALRFGWTALGITAVIHVLTLVLHDKMRGRDFVERAVIILFVGWFAVLALIGLLKLIGVLGLRLGGELTPLSWISRLISGALAWTGPLQRYMPGLVALAVVAAMLVVLVRAGRRKVKRSPPKPESFKEIKLQKFKQEDMKDIFLKQDCPVKVYSVVARLSASPPLEWIRTFEKEWRKVNANTEVRVYRDQVRFEADTRNVASIWSQLRATVNSVNCDYSQIVKKQNDALEKRQRDERDNAKEQRDIKWKTFKNLS